MIDFAESYHSGSDLSPSSPLCNGRIIKSVGSHSFFDTRPKLDDNLARRRGGPRKMIGHRGLVGRTEAGRSHRWVKMTLPSVESKV